MMRDILAILHDGHPLLAQRMPEVPVERIVSEGEGIAAMLEATMLDADGLGLAANQVGLPLRAFCMRLHGQGVETMFNPVITSQEHETATGEEGCLSFPGLILKVRRPRGVDLSYIDRHGAGRSIRLEGLEAVCAQHEIDHLDGVSFTGRVSRLTLQMARRRLEKDLARR